MFLFLQVAGCDDKWFAVAGGLCGTAAAMCQSLESAIPADKSQLEQAANGLLNAQKMLVAWASGGGVVADLESLISAAEATINGLTGLTPQQKALVDIALTTVAEVIALVAANASGATPDAGAGARVFLASHGVGPKTFKKKSELIGDFNKLAAAAGAQPIK